MSQHYKLNRIWLRFLAVSLPILLIPIIIMFFIYAKSISAINLQTFEKHVDTLQNSILSIEGTIEDVSNMISYLDSDGLIGRFLQLKNPMVDGTTTSELLKTQKDLKAFTISNQFINNIQVYSLESEVLLDATTVSLTNDSYYGSSFAINDYSAEEWQEKLLLPDHNFAVYPNLNVSFLGTKEKRILFAQSLPIKSRRYNTGNLFVYVSESKLLELFPSVSEVNGEFLCVLDDNGELVMQKNCSDAVLEALHQMDFSKGNGYSVCKIDNDNMFMTFSKGNINNWIYVAAIPKALVLEPTNAIRLSIILMICLALLVGGILLVFCSAQMSKPLANIYRVLFPIKKNLSYVNFADEVSKLVKNNDDMKSILREQIPAQKASVFYSLLLGDFNDRESIMENYSKIDIDLNEKFFIILIASLNDLSPQHNLSEVTAQKIFLREKLSSSFTIMKGIYNLDFERMVLLIASNETSYINAVEVTEKETKKIVKQLSNEQNVSISFSGALCDDITKIPEAFYHAQTAMNYVSKNTLFTVLWYSTNEGAAPNGFYFPFATESEIISATKLGNTPLLAAIFDKVEHRNKRILNAEPNDTSLNLIRAIRAALTHILNEFTDSDSLEDLVRQNLHSDLQNGTKPIEAFSLLRETFVEIANNNGSRVRQRESNIQERLQAYVNLHYTNPQISLTSVADEFQITEVYLSRLFKQITGENFSKYIEKLRIEEANRLIQAGELTRKEIAQRVGYNSPQVFRRAYNRYFDVSDTDM